MARPFKGLIQRDHEEHEECDIRHAAHDSDIAFAQQAERWDMRPGRHGAQKAKAQCDRGRDRKQQQHLEKGQIEQPMHTIGQIAGEPTERAECIGISAKRENGGPL